jgi:hypothetical protein
LATGSTAHGTCAPENNYRIYNYYCDANIVELALDYIPGPPNLAANCASVSHIQTSSPCRPVEAFIDTGTLRRPLPPVFYRCYWYSANVSGLFETVEFEWSATSEYIDWYVANIGNAAPNSVTQLLGGAVTPNGVFVPLLKVTNHSPSLF